MLLIILTVVYMFIAGLTGVIVDRRGAINCHVNPGYHDWDCAHRWHGLFSGAAWPAALPAGLGMIIASQMVNEIPKAERHREAEIEEAEHRARLARIKRVEEEETTRRLEEARR